MLTDQGLDKEDVVHVNNVCMYVLLCHKNNEIMSFAVANDKKLICGIVKKKNTNELIYKK